MDHRSWDKRFLSLSRWRRSLKERLAQRRFARPARWLISLILLFLTLLSCGQLALWINAPTVYANTRSQLKADYRPWTFTIIRPVDPAIIQEIQRDEGSEANGELVVVMESFWLTPTPDNSQSSAATATVPAFTATSTPTSVSGEATHLALTDTPVALARVTASSTLSPTEQVSHTPTATFTRTPTPLSTVTSTHMLPSATTTPEPMPTLTATDSPMVTPSPAPTQTNPPPTATPSSTPAPSATSTASYTSTHTPTATASLTPSHTPTNTPTPTSTPTSSWTPTASPTLPGTLSGSIYLHNDPSPPVGDTTSHTTLSMDSVAPSAGLLFNYDTNRDSFAGLLIAKGGAGFTESDPTKHQRWRSGPMVVNTSINGAPQLVFWSAIKDFGAIHKGGSVAAHLIATDGTTIVWSISANIQAADWQGGSTSWVETSLTFGAPSPMSIPAGYWVELVLVVEASSEDDMWFAYDTTNYPTRVVWP